MVDSLSELRVRLMDADLVSWNRLIGPKVTTTEELYGHLVALPNEEPAVRTIDSYADEEQVKAEMASRMHTYFHRIRIQHPFTRDVTTLCGWWRLDAVNSPNYEDFRKTSLGRESKDKDSDIRISDDFLSRTRTFDMSAATRDFSGLEDRGGSYARALDMLKEESRQAMVYASTQRRMLRDYHITSLFTKHASETLQTRIMQDVEEQSKAAQRALEDTYKDLPLDFESSDQKDSSPDDIEDDSDLARSEFTGLDAKPN